MAGQAHAGGGCEVFFRARRFLVLEGDGKAVVHVVRTGDLGIECHCSYNTAVLPSGARPHRDYIPTAGEVRFLAGETVKTFEVEIVNDREWELLESFHVVLSEVVGDGARLGALQVAEVCILNDDQYPSNQTGPMLETSKNLALVMAFWRERFHALFRRALPAAVGQVFQALYGIGTILLVKFLVDVAIERDSKPALWSFVAIYGLASGLSYVFALYVTDERRLTGTRTHMRNWLLKKWLLAQNSFRSRVGRYECFNVAVNDVEHLAELWWQFFVLIELLVWIVCGSIAVLILRPIMLLPVGVAILLAVLCIALRTKTMELLQTERIRREQGWVQRFGFTIENQELIDGFDLRDSMAATFADTYERFYEQHVRTERYRLNSEWMGRGWVILGFGAVIVFGGHLVIDGDLEIGTYLTLAGLTAAIAEKVGQLVATFSVIQRGVPSLKRISRLLNSQDKTIFSYRMQQRMFTSGDGDSSPAWASSSEATSKQDRRGNGKATKPAGTSALDGIPPARTNLAVREFDSESQTIVLDHVCFHHDRTSPGFDGLQLTLKPGKVYALQGDVGLGRTTLLKLLSRILVPQSGHILIPPHIFSCYVAATPQLVHGSLMDNLRLGLAPQDSDALSDERVWAVAKEFGLHTHLIGQGGFQVGDRGRNVRVADQIVICLVRALLADPDVLVLVKPGELLPVPRRLALRANLRRWMDNGGLAGVRRHDRTVQAKTMLISLVQGTEVPPDLVDYSVSMSSSGNLSVSAHLAEFPPAAAADEV